MKHRARSLRSLSTGAPLLAAVLLLGALAGCGGGNPYPPRTFDRGMYFFERGKHTEATTAFEAFVRHSPTDSLAAAAQFYKAKSFLQLKEYPLAAVEFQILRKDYPTSELVEEAFYLEGVAYLRQVGRVQRDVTGAHEARLHFLEFSRRYPASRFMPEVTAHMQGISDLMVRKRLRQCEVFRQLKHYDSVAIVLDGVLLEEAGSTLLDQVLWERARVAEDLKDPETATAMYRRLVDGYPASPLAARAQAKLGAAVAPPAAVPDES